MIILLTCMLIGENQFICLISQPDYRDWIPQFGNWHSPLSQSVYHSKKTNTLLKITFILIMTNTHVPKRYIWGGGGGGGGGGGQMKRRHRKTKTDHWHASWMKRIILKEGMKEWREGSRLPDSSTQFHVQRLWHTWKGQTIHISYGHRPNFFLWPHSAFLMATVQDSFLWPHSTFRMVTVQISFLWPQSKFIMAAVHVSYGHISHFFLTATVHISYGQGCTSTWITDYSKSKYHNPTAFKTLTSLDNRIQNISFIPLQENCSVNRWRNCCFPIWSNHTRSILTS